MLLVFATILDLITTATFLQYPLQLLTLKKGQTYLQNYNGNVLCFYNDYFFFIQNKRGI